MTVKQDAEISIAWENPQMASKQLMDDFAPNQVSRSYLSLVTEILALLPKKDK